MAGERGALCAYLSHRWKRRSERIKSTGNNRERTRTRRMRHIIRAYIVKIYSRFWRFCVPPPSLHPAGNISRFRHFRIRIRVVRAASFTSNCRNDIVSAMSAHYYCNNRREFSTTRGARSGFESGIYVTDKISIGLCALRVSIANTVITAIILH